MVEVSAMFCGPQRRLSWSTSVKVCPLPPPTGHTPLGALGGARGAENVKVGTAGEENGSKRCLTHAAWAALILNSFGLCRSGTSNSYSEYLFAYAALTILILNSFHHSYIFSELLVKASMKDTDKITKP